MPQLALRTCRARGLRGELRYRCDWPILPGMSLPRFFIPPDQWSSHELSLTGDEERHCTQVMRRGIGDEVIAFNGAGAWARCSITEASKHRVNLSPGPVEVTPAPTVSLTLLQAVPKAG